MERRYPNAQVEVWSFDEHRLGLKPIIRKIWAPVGQRPIAEVDHRYEWTYLYGFVHPATGDTEWLILPRVNGECIGCQPHRRCRDNHKADQPPNLNRIIWRTLPLR
ncbi:transposase, orfB, putative (plasmid) [Acaryochloris marina MBIC11017]|uniref:Transposase, orfB, putative n=1 Tax=Acaryochloris marina (strain MBIC 11017) TaxID=329726 RepID=A8ZPB5_ACAM1|nr:transposase, orfB, putative [Acaryochloris marina MBIC11017]